MVNRAAAAYKCCYKLKRENMRTLTVRAAGLQTPRNVDCTAERWQSAASIEYVHSTTLRSLARLAQRP